MTCVREGRVGQLTSGDVHRQHEVGADEAARHPVADLRSRGPQDPFADVADQPDLLRELDELRRRDQDLGPRSTPPDQRFDTAHASAAEVHDRLVLEQELLPVESEAQRGLGVEARQRVPLELRVEDLHAVASELLGAVHRRVGVREQLGRCALRAAAAGRHADRERDRDLTSADLDRPVQSGPDALHGRECGRSVGEVLAEHHELVAAEAADRVGVAHAARQAPGDLAQHLIAHLMAERVVDQLVVIDVHEHHSDRAATSRGRRDRLLGPRGEQRPVRQPGQRIVEALVGELGGGVRALGRGRQPAGAARGQQAERQQRADRQR